MFAAGVERCCSYHPIGISQTREETFTPLGKLESFDLNAAPPRSEFWAPGCVPHLRGWLSRVKPGGGALGSIPVDRDAIGDASNWVDYYDQWTLGSTPLDGWHPGARSDLLTLGNVTLCYRAICNYFNPWEVAVTNGH